jgi:hypothetical protein
MSESDKTGSDTYTKSNIIKHVMILLTLYQTLHINLSHKVDWEIVKMRQQYKAELAKGLENDEYTKFKRQLTPLMGAERDTLDLEIPKEKYELLQKRYNDLAHKIILPGFRHMSSDFDFE